MQKIVLISCVKKKLDHQAKAKELYISPLFCLNLKYAYYMNPNAIYILSAKYGLLELEQLIDPYEKTLNKMNAIERKSWAKKVIDSLKQKADLKSDLIIFLAGRIYRQHLIPEIQHFEIPLEGLPFGIQLSELKRRIS